MAVAFSVAVSGLARASSPSERRHELQDRLGAKRAQIEAAKTRERKLGAQIATQSERIDAVEGRIGALAAELGGLENWLAAARSRLVQLQNRLTEQNERLAFLRVQLRIAEQRLARRLVEIYTSDESDLLAVLLGARSLRDALDQIELYERIGEQDATIVAAVKHNRVIVSRLRERTADLREQQAAVTARLEGQTREHQAVQASLVGERNRLTSLRANRQRTLDSIQVQRKRWEAEADALGAESARLAELIAAASRVATAPRSSPAPGDQHFPTPSSSTPSSPGLIWPLRGSVVSPFGMRWGRLHAGLDIAAPAGAPIVAAASGTVVYAGWMGGYGLLVVVQHPNGLATAYAHNSSIAVATGDSVSQGQTIAAVGCTGYCFGNHVHFEVRLGGSPVDPIGYL